MSILDTLKTPVIVAPMAGGPSTPALVNAAAEAGSLGFLAGGVMPLEQLKQELSEVKASLASTCFARRRMRLSLQTLMSWRDCCPRRFGNLASMSRRCLRRI